MPPFWGYFCCVILCIKVCPDDMGNGRVTGVDVPSFEGWVVPTDDGGKASSVSTDEVDLTMTHSPLGR